VSPVLVREVREEDLPVFFGHQRDPEATRMALFAPRGSDAFHEHWARILRDETVTIRTITSHGRVAGHVMAFEQSGRTLVGFWIGRDHWGQGVATQALSRFLDDVPTRPLHARVAKSNLGSIRVLEKCGFTVVGEEIGAPATEGGEAVEEHILELSA
jgi:RimJ/RimL family protein N-acetyltransferase